MKKSNLLSNHDEAPREINMVRALQSFSGSAAFLAAATILLSANSSPAGVIFHVGAGPVQPDENVLFNAPNLTSTGITVEGATNQTATLVQFMSNDNPAETLTTPSQGQARIEAEDGTFSSIMILPQSAFISELEVNINVLNQQSGTFEMTVIDQFDNVFVDDFNPNTLGMGSNFFSFTTDAGTLVKKVTLTASSQIIEDIRQVRLTVVVPEPAALPALLTSLPCLLWGRRSRRLR